MKIRILTLLLAATALSGCGAGERLENIGKAPEMAPIQNPVQQAGYKPVSMPMPEVKASIRQKNSLWASDRQTFFEDQRADAVGDILTVLIDIQDEAELENETERTRTSGENADLSSFLGYEGSLGQILPEAIDPTNLVDLTGNSTHTGEGTIEREEDIQVTLAAVVTQRLPNGNMVIQGRQEVRVNFEKRILELAGVIRPEDISIDNTISYDKIAEARISYGGKGQITDVQQPRYGQQVYDVLFPF